MAEGNFIGPGVGYEAMPEGTDMCFVADFVAGNPEYDIQETHELLFAAHVSEADGLTMNIPVRPINRALTAKTGRFYESLHISAMEGDTNVDDIIGAMVGALESGSRIHILYDKTVTEEVEETITEDEEAEPQTRTYPHWAVIGGFEKGNDGLVQFVDSQNPKDTPFSNPNAVAALIAESHASGTLTIYAERQATPEERKAARFEKLGLGTEDRECAEGIADEMGYRFRTRINPGTPQETYIPAETHVFTFTEDGANYVGVAARASTQGIVGWSRSDLQSADWAEYGGIGAKIPTHNKTQLIETHRMLTTRGFNGLVNCYPELATDLDGRRIHLTGDSLVHGVYAPVVHIHNGSATPEIYNANSDAIEVIPVATFRKAA